MFLCNVGNIFIYVKRDHLKFIWQLLWRTVRSGMWHHMIKQKFTSVLEEPTAAIFRVELTKSDNYQANHKYPTEWTNQTFYAKPGGSWFLWNVGIFLTIWYQSLKTVLFGMHFCVYSGTAGTEIFHVIHCSSSLEKKIIS